MPLQYRNSKKKQSRVNFPLFFDQFTDIRKHVDNCDFQWWTKYDKKCLN